MENLIQSWIFSMLVSSFFCSVILYFCSDGKLKPLLEAACTCVMVLTLIAPFTNTTIEQSIDHIFNKWTSIENQTHNFEIPENTMRSIIESEYKAYILTEADHSGVSIADLQVDTKQDENGNWLPIAIIYTAKESVPSSFKSHIAAEIGVPEERQVTYESIRPIS